MSLRHACVRTLAFSLASIALVSIAWPGGMLASPRMPGAATTSVRGVVWNSENAPVAQGKVRLRNLRTGHADGEALTSDTGQFTFREIEAGAFVVELVSSAGKVIAVGQSFRVEFGETVATFVRLAAPQRWLAGAFSNTAAAVIAAASSAGVTAIGSPGRPVSPQ